MRKQWALFFVSAFFLNFFWEIWHAAPLYLGWNLPARYYVLPLTDAAFIDAMMLTGILAAGIILWKKTDWFATMSRPKYCYFITASILIAAVVELKGVYWLRQWQYSPQMPTLVGLGLSPLIQLMITGLAALWLARSVR